MRIQSRIYLSIAGSLIVSGVLAYFALSAVHGIGHDLERGRSYGEVINRTFALNLLVATFDQDSGRRALQQLGEVRASLTKLLDGLSSSDAREEALIRQIRRNNEEVGPLLDQFFARRTEQNGGMQAELKDMLATQLWTKVRFISDDTYRLMEISESRIISAYARVGITVLVLLITLIAANVVISWFSGRSIVRMEANLLEQREWLQVTLTSIGDAVIATDTESQISFLNLVASALTGWPIGEALGRPVQELFRIINEKTREPAEDVVSRVLREGRNVALANHTALVARDGREIPIEDSAAPIKDSSGKVAGVVLVFHDVTEKRRSEEALRESRMDLDHAQEVGQIGSWRLDVRRNVLTWSDQNHRIFGVSKGTPLTYETFLGIVHPEDRRYVDSQWNAGLRGEPYDIEHRIVVGRQVKWVREKANLEFDDTGNLQGGFGITQDITERKQAEQALRQSAQFPEENPNPVLRIAVGGALLYANSLAQNWLATFGWQAGGSLPAPVRAIVEHVCSQQHAVSTEISNPAGSTFWMVAVQPQGEDYVNLYTIDITERKRAEEALQKAHTQLQEHALKLQETNKELEGFAYTISHDLRAPLRAINGFARMLADDYGSSIEEEGKRRLAVIETNAIKMGMLIDDLLAFSRAGRTAMNVTRIDMNRLVAEVVETLKTSHAGPKPAIHVAALPPAQGDPALIRQVLANLLENAMKFSRNRPEPGIEVGSLERDGEDVYFVKDNGVGFDMKYYGKLFGVFQRLVTEREFEGTGVGLAIVERLVSRHGGRVWAEAKPGEGATFFFTLKQSRQERA